MLEEKLGQKIQKNDLNLGRIAWTTIGYGLAGSFAPNPNIFIPASAAIGCAASIYDEVKEKGLDLYTPAMAALVGGFVGALFDDPNLNEYVSHFTTYTGVLIGGALGTYNSYNSFRTKKNI